MFQVYILYSRKLDSYYIGETKEIEVRINQHNTKVYPHSYTKQADDWEPFIKIECLSRTQARKIEAHIKRMKSRKYIQNLKEFPEIIDKLKSKYQ